MVSYSGIDGKREYTLGEEIGRGGEGTVHEVRNDHTLVAKIYRSNRYSEEDRSAKERKLKAMISMNIRATVDGVLRLAWPTDILYEDEKMVGFVMPRVNSDKNCTISSILDGERKFIPDTHGNILSNMRTTFPGSYGISI